MINQPTAVVARDKQGAQIVFEGAPEARDMRLDNYLKSAFSKQITLQNIEMLDINGQEAATGSADVSLSSGAARLRVVVIRHEDSTYQFLFIMPLDKADLYNVALRRTTYSFRPLTTRNNRSTRRFALKCGQQTRNIPCRRLLMTCRLTVSPPQHLRPLTAWPQARPLPPTLWSKSSGINNAKTINKQNIKRQHNHMLPFFVFQ